jgi:hypothetical protein
VLRLCQSFGKSYNDLSGLSTTDMSAFLFSNNIVINRITNEVFSSLKLEPLKDLIQRFGGSNIFSKENYESLVNKTDNQHMTFYRYLYAYFDFRPDLINQKIQELFVRKSRMRYF